MFLQFDLERSQQIKNSRCLVALFSLKKVRTRLTHDWGDGSREEGLCVSPAGTFLIPTCVSFQSLKQIEGEREVGGAMAVSTGEVGGVGRSGWAGP